MNPSYNALHLFATKIGEFLHLFAGKILVGLHLFASKQPHCAAKKFMLSLTRSQDQKEG